MSARGLGRGFGDLIPTDIVDEDFDPTAKNDKKESSLVELKVDGIVRDAEQPRRDFKEDQLNSLAASIKEHGVLQPIVVTKEGNRYKIVAGERRWRASKIAGKKTIPAIIRTINAQKRLELSLIENVQRQDLNAIETATAYAKLKDQFNMTDAEVAKRVGKGESSVINTMRLLSLPKNVKKMMVEHNLSEGQMRPLIPATEEEIAEVLPKIIKENWSARKVEQYMVELKRKRVKNLHTDQPDRESESEKRAESIAKSLGVKVKVQTSTRGSGNIVLKFKNEREFEKLCSILTQ